MMRVVLSLALLMSPAASVLLKGPDDLNAVKAQVMDSHVFHVKMWDACHLEAGEKKDNCMEQAKTSLFCQLLERSKPDMAKQEGCEGKQDIKHAGNDALSFVQITTNPLRGPEDDLA